MMSTLDKVQLLEQRIQKASIYISSLEKKIDDLEESIKILTVHNEELQEYADKFVADHKLIDESVDSALETLSTIGALDEIELPSFVSASDLEEADRFTTGSALNIEEVSLEDLTP